MSSLDMGIALGIANYKANAQEPTVTSVTRNDLTPEDLPKTGTVDAKTFLKAIATAGCYEDGKRVPFNQERATLEIRRALAGYCGIEIGYMDKKGGLHPAPTLAQQVDVAKLRARAETDKKVHEPAPMKPSLRDEGVVNGVRGMPDNTAKHVANLRARARSCVETIIGYENAVSAAQDMSDVEKARALQALERARLVTIQRELKQF
jgi:hypothetical protein